MALKTASSPPGGQMGTWFHQPVVGKNIVIMSYYPIAAINKFIIDDNNNNNNKL
jgi:hypothetical protein